MDSEFWPQDDAVYSEAICNVEDTYYFGSEDEEYNNPTERRERYEAAAQRFLSGEQGSILLSASLRGPFGYDQGWLNPWRSKSKRQLASSIPVSQFEKSKPRQSQTRRPSRAEKPSQTTQDSQLSHLPSPESLKQVEIEPHPFLGEEDVDRVQRWQSAVPGRKDQDEHRDELATNTTPSSHTSTQRKRRAKSSDWLRQASSKKRKTAGGTEDESIKTPTRRPRQAATSGSSDRPQNSLTTPFRSSSLCPGDQDDDELGADDEPSQAPNSSFIRAQPRQLSPAKRMSPKRAMLRRNNIDSPESADELSQETTKDSRAAATLSSPVSMKDKSVVLAVHSTGSPVKKVRNTQQRISQDEAPVTQNTVSPFKKLRTPRIRKSRARHRIAALRAPLPRPQENSSKVHASNESTKPTKVKATPTQLRDNGPISSPQGEDRSLPTQQEDEEPMPTLQREELTPAAKIQDNETSLSEDIQRSEAENLKATEIAPDVRESSPLSDISSSCGSISWSGISSPESKASHGHATRTSTQSIPTTSYEESEDSEVEDQPAEPTPPVSKHAAATEPHATVEDVDEPEPYELDPELHDLDSDSDSSSELSDISMRDIYLRNSSIARMDDLVPASEMDRLDAELDSDDEVAMDRVDEEEGSESGASDYETAHSQQQSRGTTPRPPSPTHLPHDAGEQDEAWSFKSPMKSGEGDGSAKDSFEDTTTGDREPQLGKEVAAAASSIVPIEEVEYTYEVPTHACDQTIPDTYQDDSHMKEAEDAGDIATKPYDETLRDSQDVTGLSTVIDSMFEASGGHSRAQSPTKDLIAATNQRQTVSVQNMALDTTIPGELAIQATMQESVPLSSFEGTVPDETVNYQTADLAVGPSTPPPSSPEQPFDPFADFMSPSPEKRVRQRHIAQMQASLRRVSNTEGSSLCSILKTPWSDPRPEKRVSFGPLPGETEGDSFSIAPERADKQRPASPPPHTSVEQLPTSSDAEFQGHFKAMAKRASARPPQPRLIPSSPTPASQEHNFGTPLAADKVSNSPEPSDSEAPVKSLFGALGSENKPPSKRLDEFDDIFDDLASMLRPYDLDADLDEARTGEMEGLSFGGW